MGESRGEKYIEDLRDFYQEARGLCNQYAYCVDLTDAFEHEHNAYLDARHQTEAGARALARAICSRLEINGALAPRP